MCSSKASMVTRRLTGVLQAQRQLIVLASLLATTSKQIIERLSFEVLHSSLRAARARCRRPRAGQERRGPSYSYRTSIIMSAVRSPKLARPSLGALDHAHTGVALSLHPRDTFFENQALSRGYLCLSGGQTGVNGVERAGRCPGRACLGRRRCAGYP